MPPGRAARFSHDDEVGAGVPSEQRTLTGNTGWGEIRDGLPDAAGVRREHWLPLGASKGFAESIEISYRAVDAPAAG